VKAYLGKHKAEFRTKKSRAELRSYRETLAETIRHVLRVRQEPGAPSAERKAVRRITGVQLTPVILRPEKGILLPGVWLESNTSSSESPVILFLHQQGKSALAGEEQVVKALLDEGFRIFAVDLRGTGETAPGMEGYFWDFLAGKPVSGQRVADVLSVMKWLSSQGVPSERISIWAEGLSAVWAVLASALAERVSGIVLENVLISFENVVSTRLPQYNQEILLPGVLTRFDLPHVYQALCPLNITLINPFLGDKSPAGQADIAKTFKAVADTYEALGAAGNWRVIRDTGTESRIEHILSACRRMAGR
jgi:pimeloyl-ACP methyl ester carboxylesterase